MIPRLLRSEIERRLLEDRKIIILYGSRQVGKTTLIKSIIEEFDKKILHVNTDIQSFDEILSSRNLQKLRRFVQGYDLLFIDEAQRIEDIGINLKILHDEVPELKIIATGSSSFELANVIQEPLTGRTWTYLLYPIAYAELQKIHPPFELDQRLEELLLFGMYPEVFRYELRTDKSRYLKELSTSYLYKDVLELSNIRYANKLKKLLQLLAYQIGSAVSLTELGNALEMSKATVGHYIDLLEKSFVLFRRSGFSRNLRKEIVKMDKIYFFDLGIRNAVIDDFRAIDRREDRGALWENFLMVERMKYNAYQGIPPNAYFWRTYTGAELDLVEEQHGQLNGYEFKWKTKPKKVPPSWLKTYPDATFKQIDRSNYFGFIGED